MRRSSRCSRSSRAASTSRRSSPRGRRRTHARDFGRALAETHDAGAVAFGVPPGEWTGPTFIGAQPLPTRAAGWRAWGAFFAAQRVLPYAERAARRGSIGGSDLRIVQEACARLTAGDLDDGEPPARVHGDLWNGNVQWTGARGRAHRPGRVRRAPGDRPRDARPVRLPVPDGDRRRLRRDASPPARLGGRGSGCTSCTRSRCTPRATDRTTRHPSSRRRGACSTCPHRPPGSLAPSRGTRGRTSRTRPPAVGTTSSWWRTGSRSTG